MLDRQCNSLRITTSRRLSASQISIELLSFFTSSGNFVPVTDNSSLKRKVSLVT